MYQDEKLLQAVRSHGTNWTKIVSSSLPNRTSLALKNRYSALQAKARKSEAGRCENTDESEYEDEEDDDDEEDDEEEEHKTDQDNTFRMNNLSWQEQSSEKASGAQTQASQVHPMAQFPFFPPNSFDTQDVPSLSSINGQPWAQKVQEPPVFSKSFTSHPQQTHDQQAVHIASLSDMHMDGGFAFNYPIPNPLNIEQYTDHVCGSYDSQSGLPAQNRGLNVPQEVQIDTVNHISPEKGTSEIIQDGMSRSVCRQNPTPHQLTEEGRTSPKRQRITKQPHPVSDASTVLSENSASVNTPQQKPLTYCDGSSRLATHHVSVDAECTSEQLGDLMRTLVGSTKRIVVKVDG